MAPAVCHLQKNESHDIGPRDALGYHLDMCSEKGTERALPALSADHTTFSLDEYECVIGRKRERERARQKERCVCVCLKPAN